MKKIRIFVLLLSLLFIAPIASALPLHLGLKAGLVFPRQQVKFEGKSINKNQEFLFGWQAGAELLFQFPVFGWELEANALVTRKGYKYNYKDEHLSKSNIMHTTSLYYLDFPLKINYSIGLSDTGVFLGLGPTFSLALGGSITKGKVKETIEWGREDKEDKGLSRFDWALSAQAGVRLFGAQLAVFYDFGLFNIAKAKNYNIHNQNFGVNLAYLF